MKKKLTKYTDLFSLPKFQRLEKKAAQEGSGYVLTKADLQEYGVWGDYVSDLFSNGVDWAEDCLRELGCSDSEIVSYVEQYTDQPLKALAATA